MRTAAQIVHDQSALYPIDRRPQQRCETCGRFCRRDYMTGIWTLSCNCWGINDYSKGA